MIEQLTFHDALLEGAKEVFETMVFMELAEAAEPVQKIESSALLGSITFKGDIEGCLTVYCSIPCAQAIAMNMLGMDSVDELADVDTYDALGEIANMVMGSVKSRITDIVGEVSVSIPTVVSGHGLDSSLRDDSEKTSVNVSIENDHIAEFTLLHREVSD